MSDTGDTQAQGTGIEEPEVLVARCTPHIGADWPTWLAGELRARDAAVAAEARREVLEACCAAACAFCGLGRLPVVKHGCYWHSEIHCAADPIRHLAAARGWLREEAAEGEEGVRDAGTEAD